MQFKSVEERIEFLRENPIFWTRFGIEYEQGDWQKHTANAQRHKALFDKGIVVHSSVIPSGWIAPDTFDYSETDQLLELLFSTAPDIVFLPRVKVNVPEGWCAAHPDDVFVYAGGPRTRKEIQDMIGTPSHGSHPTRSTDLIAQQSFSSGQWLKDASEALRRFVLHIEGSKWADRIIGYHIAYGTSGETSMWGSWDTNPRHKGDYGINATKAFIEYAAKHGKTYTDIPPVEERFFIGDSPVPHNKFHVGTPTLEQLFYVSPRDERCILYSEFTRDVNMDAVETLCKVVKDIVPQKVTGVFHGYISEPSVCANTQHTGFDRLLASPYVDFISAPKGYTRIGPTEPGFGQSVPNSINRKKLFLDELDNRTHLCDAKGSRNAPAKSMEQTRAVYWREFTKNAVFHQGYWWMDLGGGWLDSEEIQNEVQLLNSTSKQLYLEKDRQKSVAEVLVVINENVMHRMRPNYALHDATVNYTGSIIKECGVPIDYYRTADLASLDLSAYKVIVFLNAFYEDHEKLKDILKKTSEDCHIIWNYAAGIINGEDGSFGLDNIRRLTGFKAEEYFSDKPQEHKDSCFPLLYIDPNKEITPIDYYSDGRIKMAKRTLDGRTHILSAMPSDVTVEVMRGLLDHAGVHLYAPPYCVVHTDNRFIYVLSERKMRIDVTLRQKTDCQDIFTGEVYKNVNTVSRDMDEGTCIFLKYIND